MSIKIRGRRNSALFRLDSGSKVQTSRRSSSTTFEPLEDMVTCPIDLNFLEDPRLLPCGHAFCCKCLNNYIEKLIQSMKGIGRSEQHTFPCPICRAPCFIPPDSKADSFPTAFNHKVILEFLKKYRLHQFSAKALKQDPVLDTELLSTTNTARKTSIQVSSQMLNYIVDDLTCRQVDGKMDSNDRAVIIDEVHRLLQNLQTKSNSDVNCTNQPSDNNTTTNNNQSTKVIDSSSPSTTSPTNSIRHMGRFHAVVSRIKRSSVKHSTTVEFCTEDPTYSLYREAENVRVSMKRNANYNVVTKGKDCCVMRPGEEYQSIDLKLNMNSDNQVLHRYTLTTNYQHDELNMYKQKFNLNEENKFGNLPNGRKCKQPVEQITGKIIVDGSNLVKVQYIRFHGSLIYLTGIITHAPVSQEVNMHGVEEIETNQTGEFGVLICCMASDIENKNTNIANNNVNDTTQANPFPIVATSSLFYRDVIGAERPNQPIIVGLDVDRTSGDIYVAQPANAMVCRLKENDLTRIDRTWYLNDPQLSPYFLCFSKSDHSIWATCPSEDKIIILDLDVDGYFHFTPSITFGIIPSHIICTTDNRIVILDKSLSHLYWITKVRKAICIQRLEFKFKSKTQYKILAIQSVDDEFSIENNPFMEYRNKATPTKSDNKVSSKLRGGILCAHDYGCAIVYPEAMLSKCDARVVPKFTACLNFCH